MGAISYSRFRKNPGKVIDQVIDGEEPVTITRADGRDVVIVSAEEWAALQETDHLLSSPKNVRRLRRALAEIEAGQVTEIDIP